MQLAGWSHSSSFGEGGTRTTCAAVYYNKLLPWTQLMTALNYQSCLSGLGTNCLWVIRDDIFLLNSLQVACISCHWRWPVALIVVVVSLMTAHHSDNIVKREQTTRRSRVLAGKEKVLLGNTFCCLKAVNALQLLQEGMKKVSCGS